MAPVRWNGFDAAAFPGSISDMHLSGGRHLAYCTNIHRGESWPEVQASLEQHTLAVRERVCPNRPYAIGLRLGWEAARDLRDPPALRAFRRWLDAHDCYVFTINGFPYGRFQGTRIKEQVYAPDWTTRERLDYTICLFDLLAELLPPGLEGSVSTVPGSFKEFIHSDPQVSAMCSHLWECVDQVARLSEKTGRHLHLGLEPEPLCYLETTEETARFFERLRSARPGDPRLDRHLGVNYDTCHLAVEFEDPAAALARLVAQGIRLSKIHLSSALRVRPFESARRALNRFADGVFLHQVIARDARGNLTRYRDLPDALQHHPACGNDPAEEWRVHFHIPLYFEPGETLGLEAAPPVGGDQWANGLHGFASTRDHLLGVLDAIAADSQLCRHFEMETYTWEVLPPALKARGVVDQLAAEYAWTLQEFGRRSIVPIA